MNIFTPGGQLLVLVLVLVLARKAAGQQTCRNSSVVPYSKLVHFYTAAGQRELLRYSGIHDFSNARPSVFLCSYAGLEDPNYSLKILAGKGSLHGRIVRVAAEDKAIVQCSVTVSNQRCHNVTYQELLVVVALGNSADWTTNSWLEDTNSLRLLSSHSLPRKFERNTVKCSITMDSGMRQFAELQLLMNGRPADLTPQFQFNGSHVVQTLQLDYMPQLATDSFRCFAVDHVRLSKQSANLQVTYQAGITRVELRNVDGFALNSKMPIENNETIGCYADVAKPEISYTWKVMKSGLIATKAGQFISLKGVNLYYPVCCSAVNQFEGKKFENRTCVHFRGKSITKTATFFDAPGRRKKLLKCPIVAHMGILQVRYSYLQCTARALSSAAASANGNVSISSDCNIARCKSASAVEQIKMACSMNERKINDCKLDTSSLMTSFISQAIRPHDGLPSSCFDVSDGMYRIEVDYFCILPDAKFYYATNAGRFGTIQNASITRTGCYNVIVNGASGGNHSPGIGLPGARTWYGGRGARISGRFNFKAGQQLRIVVGQHGGNSSELLPGSATTIEDNAGTGGGGGSFVYWKNLLFLAAGGGGGASYELHGVNGSGGPNGTDSLGKIKTHRGKGGVGGNPGSTNIAIASYHGGCGGAWGGTNSQRAGPEHGGHGGGKDEGWVGGEPGAMNLGAFGGFGGGGGGSEDNGASGAGGGYSGGGAGTQAKQAGGGGGSFCNGELASHCNPGIDGGNPGVDGKVEIYYLRPKC